MEKKAMIGMVLGMIAVLLLILTFFTPIYRMIDESDEGSITQDMYYDE